MNQTEKLVEALKGFLDFPKEDIQGWIEMGRPVTMTVPISLIINAQQALESYNDGWISVEERLPEATSIEHQDSEWVLCIQGIDGKFPQPAFVAWYNYKVNQFTVAHHYAHSNAATVTHWQPLPTPPQTKTV